MSWKDWFFSFRRPPEKGQAVDERVVDAVRTALERDERCREIFGALKPKARFTMPSWGGFCFPGNDDESGAPGAIALFEIHGEKAKGEVSVSFSRSESNNEEINIQELEVTVDGTDEAIWLISQLSPEEREEVIKETEEALRDDEDEDEF